MTTNNSESHDPLVGTILDGKYRIESKLGMGGMGAVYIGEHLKMKRRVAIKTLLSQFTTNENALQRFYREAQTASAIGHPNIVTIHDLGETADGLSYIVMELLDGCDLGVEVKMLLREKGELISTNRALAIMRQVAEGLAAAHEKGVVHRDLKPDNIFLTPGRAGIEHVKLLDFGISKIRAPAPDQAKLTTDGSLLGTPNYMSPEQAQGQSEIDHRADIYAFGVILYEVMTGQVPFDDENILRVISQHAFEEPKPPHLINPHIPPSMETIIFTAMSKDPAARFQTMNDVINSLAGVARELGLSSASIGSESGITDGTGSIGSASHSSAQGLNVRPPIPISSSSHQDSWPETQRFVQGDTQKKGGLGIKIAIAAVILVLLFGLIGVLGIVAVVFISTRDGNPPDAVSSYTPVTTNPIGENPSPPSQLPIPSSQFPSPSSHLSFPSSPVLGSFTPPPIPPLFTPPNPRGQLRVNSRICMLGDRNGDGVNELSALLGPATNRAKSPSIINGADGTILWQSTSLGEATEIRLLCVGERWMAISDDGSFNLLLIPLDNPAGVVTHTLSDQVFYYGVSDDCLGFRLDDRQRPSFSLADGSESRCSVDSLDRRTHVPYTVTRGIISTLRQGAHAQFGNVEYHLTTRRHGTAFLEVSARQGRRERWKRELQFVPVGGSAIGALAMVATPDAVVVFGSTRSGRQGEGITAIGLNAENGSPRFTTAVSPNSWIGEVFFNNRYVLLGMSGRMVAIDPSTGAIAWSIGR